MHDPYVTLRQQLEAAVLDGSGELAAPVRAAAAAGNSVPPEAAAYVNKVHRHAYKVIDEEVAALQAAGYTEDQLFELTVSAAVGAARVRLQAGLRALAAALEEGSHAAQKS